MKDLEYIIDVGDNFGKQVPNRDQALEKIYDFMLALSQGKPANAKKLVITDSLETFRVQLDQLLRPFWKEILAEDPELSRDLSLEISDPYFVKEQDSYPQFSRNDFNLIENEQISIRVAINGEVIPVHLNFTIKKYDEIYFLKLEAPSKGFL